jgi:hypothetical protein
MPSGRVVVHFLVVEPRAMSSGSKRFLVLSLVGKPGLGSPSLSGGATTFPIGRRLLGLDQAEVTACETLDHWLRRKLSAASPSGRCFGGGFFGMRLAIDDL